MSNYILYIFSLLFWGCIVYGQEICDNGIDDDMDGLIDCYDPECGNTEPCEDFYLGIPDGDTTCVVYPNSDTFELVKLWTNPENSYGAINLGITGDIDADGTPEVFAINLDGNIAVINGKTGKTENYMGGYGINFFSEAVAIGDVDKDGFGEVFTRGFDGLESYNHLGVRRWRSSTFLGRLNLADFNEDGTPELYGQLTIVNSLTGEKLASRRGNSSHNSAVAMDILPDTFCNICTGLELAAGDTVYAVDIENGIIQPVSWIEGKGDGWTSVADVNVDGQLDIVVQRSFKYGFRPIWVYVWDPITGEQIGTDYIPYPEGTNVFAYAGRANVGNYDSDSELEIGLAEADFYTVLDYNPISDSLLIKWKYPTTDRSSGYTGSSAFDLNCDGIKEILYRDEANLYIFDGPTGKVRAKTPCTSGTGGEFPVVVDVNNDGYANIVCDCGTSPTDISQPGNMTAFGSKNYNWVGTRKVFNQYNYFATNVNDDLTIPTVIQSTTHDSLPILNAFLNQPSLLDKFGNPICYVPGVDLSVTIDALIDNDCEYTIGVSICNHTDKENSNAAISLEFYEGIPLPDHTNLMSKQQITASLSLDECNYQEFTFPKNRSYKLYVVLSDTFTDCNLDNNMDSVDVTSPIEVSFTGLDSFYCLGDDKDTLKFSPAGGFFEGEGISDSIFDPNLVAPGGPYSITYNYITTSPACTLQATRSTYVGPDVTFPRDRDRCSNDTVRLVAKGGTSYLWQPSTGLSDSTSGDILAYPSETTTYLLTIADSFGCQATEDVLITLQSSPELSLNISDTTVCEGEEILLEASGATSYFWSPTQGLSSNTGSQVLFQGTSSVIYKVTGVNEFNCLSFDSISISVIPAPKLSLDTVICLGDTATIIEDINYEYDWEEVNSLLLLPNIIKLFPEQSTTYYYTISDMNSCVWDDSVIVTVPEYNFSNFDTTLFLGECLSVNLSPLNFTYNWQPMVGVSDSSIFNPSLCPLASTLYQLTGTDSNGCSFNALYNIEIIDEALIAVPSVFSPNGDGLNDLFIPFLKGVESGQMAIYNRWGDNIYQINKLEDMAAGWDGTYNNQPQPVGMYYYIISVIDINKTQGSKEGSFMLLR